jgi:hypothetical protein
VLSPDQMHQYKSLTVYLGITVMAWKVVRNRFPINFLSPSSLNWGIISTSFSQADGKEMLAVSVIKVASGLHCQQKTN